MKLEIVEDCWLKDSGDRHTLNKEDATDFKSIEDIALCFAEFKTEVLPKIKFFMKLVKELDLGSNG